MTKVEPTKVVRRITQVIYHENFTTPFNGYDVAVMKLDQELDLEGSEAHLGTICLPDREALDEMAGHSCIASGWGSVNGGRFNASAVLNKITGQIWPQSKCSQRNDNAVKDMMVCFGDDTLDHNAGDCFGDSGGPMVCRKDDRWFQYGIDSFSRSIVCGIPKYGEIFARTSELSAWIWDTIRKS